MREIFKKIGKFIFYVFIVLVLILVLLWIMRQIEDYNTLKKEIVVEGTFTIKLNESLESYKERMGKILNIDKHPAGVSWYEIDFDFQNEESKNNTYIEVEVGDSHLKFDYPIDIMISVSSLPKVDDFSLSLGIGSTSKTTHEEAKAKMYEILEKIVDDGWKRYIVLSDPRICGKEALSIQKDVDLSGLIGLDENYFMNFEEWFSMSTYNWHFYYKNEALMYVTLHRQGGDNNLNKPGGYFLSIDIKSVETAIKNGFKPEERYNWRELYLKNLPRNNQFRIEAEEDAIAKGYHICTDYEDAPRNKGILPPLRKNEIVPQKQKAPSIIIRSGELCPKSGLWQAFLPPSHQKAHLIAQSNAHTIHCAKDTHILKFGLSPEDEAQVRWKWIAEKQEQYNPNK